MNKFEIGDLVAPQGNTQLRSGASAYSFAVVVLADPLILVSEGGDMKWESTTNGMNLAKKGMVNDKVVKKLQKRLYDNVPEWLNYNIIIKILKDLWHSCIDKDPEHRMACVESHCDPDMIDKDGELSHYFNDDLFLNISNDEISAPFQHDWARIQHWMNVILKRLRLLPIQVKIPQSYINKWGNTLKIENNKIVGTGNISHNSRFGPFYADQEAKVKAIRAKAKKTGMPIITAQQNRAGKFIDGNARQCHLLDPGLDAKVIPLGTFPIEVPK